MVEDNAVTKKKKKKTLKTQVMICESAFDMKIKYKIIY